MAGALIGVSACAQMPVQQSAAPSAPTGTWVGSTQVLVFCPGGKMSVWDPSMRTQWCQGSYAPDGQFTANCNVSGRAHTSVGRCSLKGGTMNCSYSANNQPYSFNFTRGSGGVCQG
jgi:hypothetical protein